MTKRETSAEIDDVAAGWAVRVDEGPLDPKGQAALDAWLAGDTRRLGAYARARAVFAHAGRAKALGSDFDPDAYATEAGAVGASLLAAPITFVHEREPARLITRRRILAWGGSAAAAGAVGMIGLSWPAAAQTYRTAKGEIRLVPLEDGSSITLNTATEVRVRYSAAERHIDLIDGEALFDVARDPSRPFLVIAGDTQVKAVGTSFTVRQTAARPVEVLVRQGTVEIARLSTPQVPARRVAANVRASAPPSAPVVETTLQPAEVGRELAWREGMLSFEDMPLQEAAAEFARYSDIRISFADASIGRETVTGLYAANNPRGFARSAALSLGLHAQNDRDGVIIAR